MFEISLPIVQRFAARAGQLVRIRVPMLAANSLVHPGEFAGLDLESGRLHKGSVDQVRMRHRFASGNTRVVTVMPQYTRGDLLWVRPPSGARSRSQITLRVRRVMAARLQDMSDTHAIGLGIESAPPHMKDGTPRQRFGLIWDSWRLTGREPWAANQWCWVLEVEVLLAQVDELLGRGRSA